MVIEAFQIVEDRRLSKVWFEGHALQVILALRGVLMTTTTRELLGIFVLLGSFWIDTLFGRLTTLINLAIFAPITLLLGLGNVISVALLM